MKIILLILTLFSFLNASSQEYDAINLTSQQLHDRYAKKRSTNTIVGWSMIGTGIGMAIAGYGTNMSGGIVDNDTTNNNKGVWLIYAGGATTVASIPFFIAANKNKRKARLELKKDVVLYNVEPVRYTGISLTIDF